MIEIRFHGRGGQGAVTAAEILAKAAFKDGKYVSNGGRVLGFVCLGDDVKDAQDKVYANIDQVAFENSFYRHDIGGKR